MKRFVFHFPVRYLLIFIIALFCGGCGNQKQEDKAADSSGIFHYEPGKVNALVPVSPGTETVGTDYLTLDFSSVSQGYFTCVLSEDKRINIQVIGPDQVTYKYFLDKQNETEVFPLTAGAGSYVILVFEGIGNDQYITLMSHSMTVEFDNEFLPFLYPNQYVDFSPDSEAVALARELSVSASSDLDALNTIYEYVTANITYDNQKAETVQAGYLPDIDDILSRGTGICFDYAALTVAMLRSLSIPARLNIGYSGDIRHAWVDVYIESMGWVENAIEFNGNEWKLMDPTFASALGGTQEVINYIGNGATYTLQYVR